MSSPSSEPAAKPYRAHPKDPLHGVTLQMILEKLVAVYGWEGLADRMKVNCFHFDPSVKSSLTFLRKTPWARAKVEKLFLNLPASSPTAPQSAPEPGGLA